MKNLTNYKLQVTRIAFCFLLSAFCIITNAQTEKNIILDSATIQQNELKMTPEIEEAAIMWLKNLPERAYSDYGIEIKDQAQLENLHLGKPIPWYFIVNDKLETVLTFNASRMAEGKTLSLQFINTWNIPVMSDGEPILFEIFKFSDYGRDPYVDGGGINNTIEHFHNYEHKDSIIGSVGVTPLSRGMDYLIIKKENKVFFVEVYDEITGEYFKTEYSFSELINHIKELELRRKEAQMRYYAQIADKTELEMTPEITEMLLSQVYSSHINDSDKSLSDWGIKDRAQLENLHLGKPIPVYRIINENLTFIGKWNMLVMSEDEPLFMTSVAIDDAEQYRCAGGGGAGMAEIIHNYENKELLIGFLGVKSVHGWDYLIIRKDNKDIFVKSYEDATGKVSKTKYSLNEIINLLKK